MRTETKSKPDTTIVPIPKSEQIKAAVLAIDPEVDVRDCRGCLLVSYEEALPIRDIHVRVYPDHRVTYEVYDGAVKSIKEPEITQRAARILATVHEAIR